MQAPPLPSHLDIDLSSKCNLRCSFCHLSYFDPPDKNQQIDLEQFETKVAPLLPHLKSITLFSKYEALTARDFIPIFRRIQEHDIETYFSTNGLLLTPDVLEVLAGRLSFLTVSITGFSRATYARFMRTDALHVVQENLTALNALKRRLGTTLPKLRISTVGMQDTLEELPRAIDFAKRFDAQEGIQLTSLYAFDPSLLPQMPLSDIGRYNRLTALALDYARSQGVPLTLQSGALADNAEETGGLGHRECALPWQRLSIQPNGDVYPCPVAYRSIGSLARQSIEEIWTGAALQAFRAGVNDLARMNEDCRKCVHCRHHNITRPEGNDFSQTETFIGGMVRRPKKLAVAGENLR